jgi:hypothetical protein
VVVLFWFLNVVILANIGIRIFLVLEGVILSGSIIRIFSGLIAVIFSCISIVVMKISSGVLRILLTPLLQEGNVPVRFVCCVVLGTATPTSHNKYNDHHYHTQSSDAANNDQNQRRRRTGRRRVVGLLNTDRRLGCGRGNCCRSTTRQPVTHVEKQYVHGAATDSAVVVCVGANGEICCVIAINAEGSHSHAKLIAVIEHALEVATCIRYLLIRLDCAIRMQKQHVHCPPIRAAVIVQASSDDNVLGCISIKVAQGAKSRSKLITILEHALKIALSGGDLLLRSRGAVRAKKDHVKGATAPSTVIVVVSSNSKVERRIAVNVTQSTQSPTKTQAEQKISNTEGNFEGVLGNYDNFGCSVCALGDL